MRLAGKARELGETRRNGILGLASEGLHLLADGGEAVSVSAGFLAGEEGLFLGGIERGGFNLADLMFEKVGFAGKGSGVLGEAFLFGVELHPFLAGCGVGLAERRGVSEGVEEQHLLIAGEETLVIVGAVKVDETVANFAQQGERAGRTVGELFSAAGQRDGAADDERAALAGLEARRFEKRVDGRLGRQQKCAIDRAGVCAGADEGFVRAFAQEEFDGTEDDGFSRAGLARDRDAA